VKINGIEIEPEPDENGPYEIKSRGWEIYTYRISKAQPVTRDQLENLIGQKIDGREILAVESYAVERQEGKAIGLAFNIE